MTALCFGIHSDALRSKHTHPKSYLEKDSKYCVLLILNRCKISRLIMKKGVHKVKYVEARNHIMIMCEVSNGTSSDFTITMLLHSLRFSLRSFMFLPLVMEKMFERRCAIVYGICYVHMTLCLLMNIGEHRRNMLVFNRFNLSRLPMLTCYVSSPWQETRKISNFVEHARIRSFIFLESILWKGGVNDDVRKTEIEQGV